MNRIRMLVPAGRSSFKLWNFDPFTLSTVGRPSVGPSSSSRSMAPVTAASASSSSEKYQASTSSSRITSQDIDNNITSKLYATVQGEEGSCRALAVLPRIAKQEFGGLFRCLAVVVSQHMGVGLQEKPDVGVANPLTDHLRADAGPQRAGGVGVAQIVESDARQARRGRQSVEALADRVG